MATILEKELLMDIITKGIRDMDNYSTDEAKSNKKMLCLIFDRILNTEPEDLSFFKENAALKQYLVPTPEMLKHKIKTAIDPNLVDRPPMDFTFEEPDFE